MKWMVTILCSILGLVTFGNDLEKLVRPRLMKTPCQGISRVFSNSFMCDDGVLCGGVRC